MLLVCLWLRPNAARYMGRIWHPSSPRPPQSARGVRRSILRSDPRSTRSVSAC